MRRALVATLAVVLAAAACTSDGEPPGAGATPTSTATPSEAQPSPTEGVFGPNDDVLTVAIDDPATLDPMRIKDPGGVLVARQLYEGLTRWDPAEEKVVGAAAESWDVSDGGRTFTFHLRPGMTFHDGSPVKAEDFVFAFERIAQKGSASDIAYTLERVDGFVEVNQLGDAAHLRGLTAADALTLRIELIEPYRDLPAVLTHSGLVPLKAKVVEDLETFIRAPIGNGPFKIAQAWQPGRPVLLKPFLGFVDTPELDGIAFLPFPDAAASWLQFVDQKVDVAEVPAGQIEAAEKAYGSDGFVPFMLGYYYGFNLRVKGLDDHKLRAAVSRAINRERISKSIYRGTMQPPRGIVPVGMPGFQENICVPLCQHAPGIARRLVKKLPAKERELTIQFNREPPHSQVARFVAEDLRAIGLRVHLKGYSLKEHLERIRKGDQDFYRLGWIAEYPVPDVFLSSLFESDSPDNDFGFSSKRVDELLKEAHAEPSAARRVQLYIEAEKAILKELPIVPIGSFVTHWAAQPYVDGILFDVMGGFDSVEVSLEGA